jgi:hypothetical protein
MSTTSVKEIERNRSMNAELDHVSAPWAHSLRIGEAAYCFAPGDGT